MKVSIWSLNSHEIIFWRPRIVSASVLIYFLCIQFNSFVVNEWIPSLYNAYQKCHSSTKYVKWMVAYLSVTIILYIFYMQNKPVQAVKIILLWYDLNQRIIIRFIYTHKWENNKKKPLKIIHLWFLLNLKLSIPMWKPEIKITTFKVKTYAP